LPRWIIWRAKSSLTPPRNTHSQWLEFLKQIDREIPLSQHIHIIPDNYSTHKHPAIKHWLARHPRFEVHFTPPAKLESGLINEAVVPKKWTILDSGAAFDQDHIQEVNIS
jgi:hypothetical protein